MSDDSKINSEVSSESINSKFKRRLKDIWGYVATAIYAAVIVFKPFLGFLGENLEPREQYLIFTLIALVIALITIYISLYINDKSKFGSIHAEIKSLNNKIPTKEEQDKFINSNITTPITTLTTNLKEIVQDPIITEITKLDKDIKESRGNVLGELKKTYNGKFDDYIYDKKQLLELEGSVVGKNECQDPQIYIQSSKFILEEDEQFRDMIVNNLRKGVRYNYLIPTHDYNHQDYVQFRQTLLVWWQYYSIFLTDQNYCQDLLNNNKKDSWQKEYLSYINQANEYYSKSETKSSEWEKLINDLFSSFKRQLYAYKAEESRFYVVTAIYQVKPELWKAIVKLPTIDKTRENDFISYVVFGTETVNGDKDFIRKFRNNFKSNYEKDHNRLFKEVKEHIKEMIGKNVGKHKKNEKQI